MNNIILKKSPKIDFYAYDDMQHVELNKPWFPRLAKWLRVITWIFNGVPYFPNAETYKKSNIIIHSVQISLWVV